MNLIINLDHGGLLSHLSIVSITPSGSDTEGLVTDS